MTASAVMLSMLLGGTYLSPAPGTGIDGCFIVQLRDDLDPSKVCPDLRASYGGELVYTYTGVILGCALSGWNVREARQVAQDDRVRVVEQCTVGQVDSVQQLITSTNNDLSLDRIDQRSRVAERDQCGIERVM